MYYTENSKRNSQYINYFERGLLVKQEYYIKDTLRSYNCYLYDKKKKLIEDRFHNTPNGFGFALDKSITGDYNKKDLYPNTTQKYSYKTNKDTIIMLHYDVYDVKHDVKSLRTVRKNYECKDYCLLIKETYFGKYPSEILYDYKYKSKKLSHQIIKFNMLGNCYKTIETEVTPNKIISKIKSDFPENNQERIITTNIEVLLYDAHGNWLKKIYKEDDFISEIVEREVEYY